MGGMSRAEFDRLRQLVYDHCGITLHDGKETLVVNRLGRRLRALELGTFREYLTYLESPEGQRAEHEHFINALTTNKTNFFREPHHFEFLARRAVPEALARAARGEPRTFRVWCAAASTGQEPYTLAMTLREAFAGHPGWDVRILASDIDTDVLRRAARGRYTPAEVDEVPAALRASSFERMGTGEPDDFRVVPELRRLIQFRRVNLIGDTWPFQGRFDLIFCRNVVIYFDRPTQAVLFRRFRGHLKETGYLVMGHSESLYWMNDQYAAVQGTIYRPFGPVPMSDPPAAMTVSEGTEPRNPVDQRSTPPAPITPPAAPHRPMPLLTGAPRGVPAVPRAGTGDVSKTPVRNIGIGELHAGRKPEIIRTVLGSCVAVCLFDPQAQVGGMNHILLPGTGVDDGGSTRYGIHAMEVLIGALQKLGADRGRLVAKVFGGAHVLRESLSSLLVNEENVRFVREYLDEERIPIVSERVGGTRPLEVRFACTTGKALVRPLRETNATQLVKTEQKLQEARRSPLLEGDRDNVTFFQ